MEITKSSRHKKIIGDFGENLICNWLSRSGFEVALIDHTGIDIIAYNSKTKKRYGISVKSRLRIVGKEKESVNIFEKKKGDRKKLLDACIAFDCEPWIAVYVETSESSDVYLINLKNYDQRYRGKERKTVDDWKMGNKYIESYKNDPDVKHIRIQFKPTNWDWIIEPQV